MKTNQLMTRPMGQFKVIQRTLDGMFNATDLLTQWNKASGQQKQISHYTDNATTQEFMQALMNEEDIKERKSVLLQNRGKNGGTWMHPFLFLDFAMWINPTFKVKVIKFVYDEMIKYRNDAGDAYRDLGCAVGKIVNKSFMPVAMSNISKAINYCVFNAHETMLRNKEGDENKMRDLWQLERKVADLIDEGFINSYDKVMNYLRGVWRNRYTPRIMQLSTN